jgi:hypothetical protein
VAIALPELPEFFVLEPQRGVEIAIRLTARACELEVELQREAPGRSLIVLIGLRDGRWVQRARIAGHAKLLFDPERAGEYKLALANPMTDRAVVRVRGREIRRGRAPTGRARRYQTDPAFR